MVFPLSSVCACVHVCVCVCVYVCVCMCLCVRESERERESKGRRGREHKQIASLISLVNEEHGNMIDSGICFQLQPTSWWSQSDFFDYWLITIMRWLISPPPLTAWHSLSLTLTLSLSLSHSVSLLLMTTIAMCHQLEAVDHLHGDA